jgi:hypothetical protein
MDNSLIAIFGGLLGSIFTVVITKALEIIQKKNEFQYELKKQFFTKKLEAAEAAIMQYSLFSDALNQLIIIYARYEESSTDIGKNMTDNLLKQVDEKLALANSSSLALSNSITLYFDLTANFTANQVLLTFFDELSKLSPYMENTDFTHRQYLDHMGGPHENEALEIYNTSEKYLAQAMKDVSEGYKIFEQELRNQILQIRNQMKIFE